MDKSRNPCIGSQAKQHEHTGCAMKYPEACAISDCLCLPSDVPQSVCQSIYLSAYLNTLFLPVSVCIAASVCACLFDCIPVLPFCIFSTRHLCIRFSICRSVLLPVLRTSGRECFSLCMCIFAFPLPACCLSGVAVLVR
jgi:hypothetical protein